MRRTGCMAGPISFRSQGRDSSYNDPTGARYRRRSTRTHGNPWIGRGPFTIPASDAVRDR